MTKGQTVTITATVKDTSNSGTTVNGGTVTFTDGATTIGSATVSNGTAQMTTSTLAEGTHQIVASYGGTSSSPVFGVSSGNYDQRVDDATTVSGTYSFCNTGAIAVPGGSQASGAASPYPSNITVANLPGTLNTLTVGLSGFSAHSTVDNLTSLLVAPNGSNLDFFSLAGGSGSVGAINLTFADASRIDCSRKPDRGRHLQTYQLIPLPIHTRSVRPTR